jgi:flagella basal body P-ring formation protein FlgA
MTLIATENRHNRLRAFQHGALRAAILLMVATSAAVGQEAGAGVNNIESIDSMRATAESFVRSQLPRDASVADVTAGSLDHRLRLARCKGGLHAQLPPGATLQARSMVAIACKGPVLWTVYVSVTVESRISVLVLKHPVARDARLTIADVTVETRKVTGLTTAFLTDAKDLESRSVERPLPMGTTLTADMLKPDLVIRHGQDVTLVASAGGIEVRASGRALADGAAGTRLKVQNSSSLKVVEGVVEGPDLVRVAQ